MITDSIKNCFYQEEGKGSTFFSWSTKRSDGDWICYTFSANNSSKNEYNGMSRNGNAHGWGYFTWADNDGDKWFVRLSKYDNLMESYKKIQIYESNTNCLVSDVYIQKNGDWKLIGYVDGDGSFGNGSDITTQFDIHDYVSEPEI